MKDIPVEVTGISVFAPINGFVVILKELEGDRLLPIYIGAPEAHNISLLLRGAKYVRPLTYDLFNNLLTAAESKIECITVTDLRDSTFFAEVMVKVRSRTTKVNARPSDAIALAIKTKAPIYVNPKVLNEAGLVGDVTSGPFEISKRIDDLSKQLNEAVEIEAYEEAAKIRDRIRALEEKQRSS